MQVEFKFPALSYGRGHPHAYCKHSGILKNSPKDCQPAAILSSEKVGAPMIYDIATDINAFLEAELVV